MPAAAALPSSEFKSTHDGSPDYAVATDVAALGSAPWVHLILEESGHPLVRATSFAPWQDSPVAAALGHGPGKCIRQSILDSWCLAGEVVAAYLHQHKSLLLLSANYKPTSAGDLFVAHILVGDLDIESSRDYTDGPPMALGSRLSWHQPDHVVMMQGFSWMVKSSLTASGALCRDLAPLPQKIGCILFGGQ